MHQKNEYLSKKIKPEWNYDSPEINPDELQKARS